MSVFLLSEADRAEIAVDADVCVVGAGIAGLVLATRLARSKRRIVVVESGGKAFGS
jgi:choline dehydrogenase-like flavoprotein